MTHQNPQETTTADSLAIAGDWDLLLFLPEAQKNYFHILLSSSARMGIETFARVSSDSALSHAGNYFYT